MQQSGSLQFTDLCAIMGTKHTRWNVARLALGSLLLVMSTQPTASNWRPRCYI